MTATTTPAARAADSPNRRRRTYQTPAIVTSPTLAIINSKVAKQHGATDDSAAKDTAGQWLSSPASQGSQKSTPIVAASAEARPIITGKVLNPRIAPSS